MSDEVPRSQAPARRISLRLAVILVGIISTAMLMGGVLVKSLLRHGNCGGNVAALFACGYLAHVVAEEARGRPGFRLADLDWTEASRVLQHNEVVTEDEFLLAPPNTVIDPKRRELVIVCKTAYGNVPRPFLDLPFLRHWAHAVGYSNGEHELISPAQFKQLDVSGFVPADAWPAGR